MTDHLQPMPVADAICSPGVRAYYPERIDELHWAAHIRDAMLARSTRVNFGAAPHQQDILPVTHDGETVGAELAVMLRDHIGPQKLPFDDMWFEGVWPSDVGGWVKGARNAAICASTRINNPDTGWQRLYDGFLMTIYFLMDDGSIVRFPRAVRVTANDDGVPEDLHAPTYAHYDGASDPLHFYTALALVLPAMWAIGLMNCRNVKTQEVQRVATKTKKQRRARNTSALSYHTIVLPRHDSGGGGDGGATGRARLHTVRGHFATYTGEAPLFGKYTGTFWRPWSLRGNPDRGVVESDYKLEAAE
jgi:hypothetical protein